jgi:hypothetical protein
MAPEWMAGVEAWVIEVLARRAGHTEALHHAAGALIGRNRKRNNLIEAQYLKSEINRRLCRFGGVAPPPMFESEPPAYFNARRERSFKGWHIETDETYKVGDPHYFHGPATKPVAIEVLSDVRNPSVAFLAG